MEKEYFKCEDLVKIMRLHCNIDSQHGFCYIEKKKHRKGACTMKIPYTCTRCANRCKIAYEWDEETQKIGEMDGMLCATGITALVSKILFGERNEEEQTM
jgi:hypothetical protein